MASNKDKIRIAIVEDDPVFGKMLQGSIDSSGDYRIRRFKDGKSFIGKIYDKPDIIVLDYMLPDSTGLELIPKINEILPDSYKIIVSAQEEVDVVVKSYKEGASAYIVKNMNCFPEVIKTVQNFVENIELRRQIEQLKSDSIEVDSIHSLVGKSSLLEEPVQIIKKAIEIKMPVLLYGERGLGKLSVAKYICTELGHPVERFKHIQMPVDLASFQEILDGKIYKSHCVYVEDISILDSTDQAKLFQLLENYDKIKKNDMMLILGSHLDLEQMMLDLTFREEVYYKLASFEIRLPPLRERKEDIPLLSNKLITDFCLKEKIDQPTLTREAVKKLMKHDWPVNLRELRSVVERAVLLSDGTQIEASNIQYSTKQSASSWLDEERSMDDYKILILQHFLNKYDNDVDLVAEKLGIGRATVYRMLKLIPDRILK